MLSAVDANAELKRFTYLSKMQAGANPNTIEAVNNKLEIKEGEILRPIKLISDGIVSPSIEYPDGSLYTSRFTLNSSTPDIDVNNTPIVGPAIINFNDRYKKYGRYSLIFIYDLQKASTSSSGGSASNLPSNTVVIPTDASGPVEIIMESSKDLVNWTRAEPGTYGADTPKRFFRVRAVVKE